MDFEQRPLELLSRWLDEARDAKVSAPGAMILATTTTEGRPSARVVSLKRIGADSLVFTTAFWTRKVDELRGNPAVACVFHWSDLGRQVRVEGCAEIAERELAEELFASRPRDRQLQAIVSHQGESIDDLAPLRARLVSLQAEMAEEPIVCPEDWGAVRVVPTSVEFWQEAPDRLHDRLLFEAAEGGWRQSRLAP